MKERDRIRSDWCARPAPSFRYKGGPKPTISRAFVLQELGFISPVKAEEEGNDFLTRAGVQPLATDETLIDIKECKIDSSAAVTRTLM